MSVAVRFARGLLDYLDSKGVGRTPGELADQWVGTIDARPFLDVGRLELFQASTVSTGGHITDVPVGEQWLLYGIGGSIFNLANTVRYTAGFSLIDTDAAGTAVARVATPDTHAVWEWLPIPIMLPSSSTLFFEPLGAPGAAQAQQLNAFIQRFRA